LRLNQSKLPSLTFEMGHQELFYNYTCLQLSLTIPLIKCRLINLIPNYILLSSLAYLWLTIFLVLDGAAGSAKRWWGKLAASPIMGDVDRKPSQRLRERDVVSLVGVVATQLAGRTEPASLVRTEADAPVLRRRADRELDVARPRHGRRSSHPSLKNFRLSSQWRHVQKPCWNRINLIFHWIIFC